MKSLVSWCFSLLRSLSTRKTSFPRSGYSSNILSGLSGLLCSSKLEKASQPIQRLLSELLSGDGEIRTLDPLLARQVLSQLSYTPMDAGLPSFEAIPYSFMFCIYFNQPVTSCITLLGNGLKWTRTTDLTLIRRAL